MLFAPGTIAAKKSGFRGWALALARPGTGCTLGLRRRLEAVLYSLCSLAFGVPGPIPPVLGLAFLSTVGGPPISLARPPSPPATSFGTALGATIPSLRTGGMKGLLATLEQTRSLPRLTCPLTGSGLAASLMWAQGSCELPTAKSRTRRLLPPLRGAFLDHDSPIGRPPPSKLTTIRPRVQATRMGTSRLKPTNYSLVPGSLKEWYPRRLLPTRSGLGTCREFLSQGLGTWSRWRYSRGLALSHRTAFSQEWPPPEGPR